MLAIPPTQPHLAHQNQGGVNSHLVDAPDLTAAPRNVGVGVQRFDEVVLGALDADNGDVYLGEHRAGVDVRERPLAELQPPFDRDRVVYSRVYVERQRCRYLGCKIRRKSGRSKTNRVYRNGRWYGIE